MKVIHLSDLHIGKRVNEFSMIEDQEYILEEILKIIDSENPEVVMIAGDVYDKSVPPAEAVELFDDFLFKLAKKRDVTVLIIAGNHDSVARLSFGSRLFDNSGVYISPTYDGNIKEVSLSDEYGNVNFYLLPFIKPVNVRHCFPEEEINSYTDAVKVAIGNIDLNEDERNVLITHQFVTGAVRSDSEEVSVGGSDNVDGEIFKKFDYVALGHIHKPQKIMRDTIRYCGTPLKYSFSEANHQKSVTILEFGDKKEEVKIRTRELIPLRDLREIKGTYMEVTAKSFYENTNKEDYLHITLTDEENIVDAIGKLRTIYPNIMRIDYDNERTRTENTIDGASDVETKSPLELFEDFYKLQNNGEINSEQENYLVELIEKVWEGK